MLVSDESLLSSLPVFGHAAGELSEMPLIEHIHRGKCEVILVLSGCAQVISSGIPHTLYERDCFIVRENEPHYFAESPDSSTELLWFQIDTSKSESFMGLDKIHSEILISMLSSFSGRHINLHEFIVQDFSLSFELLSRSDPVSKLKGAAQLVLCLTRMLETKNELAYAVPELDLARRYIEEHIKEHIPTSKLLDISGVSAPELKTLFIDITGYPPREYISRTKIDRLRGEIVRSKSNISDIAYDYGFSSMHRFKQLFKKVTGVSPQKYRKKYSK